MHIIANIKNTLKHRLHGLHFAAVLTITSSIAVGFFYGAAIVGWLLFPIPSAHQGIISDSTLVEILTVDLLVIFLGLIFASRTAKRKNKLLYQKSYLICGMLLFAAYLIAIVLVS